MRIEKGEHNRDRDMPRLGYLKGKSAAMLYEQFGELKYKYRKREFWRTGYCVDTVGKNKEKIAAYIRKQACACAISSYALEGVAGTKGFACIV